MADRSIAHAQKGIPLLNALSMREICMFKSCRATSLLLSLFLLTCAAQVGASTPKLDLGPPNVQSAWGEASYSVSEEYLYVDKPSLKLEFPGSGGGVYFVPKVTDWSG